ncbi:mechanosensitive ion channel family protein [Acidithiobacillus sp. IBUN Pt1247-S3]|uniref:mechanosensitive ion channel family protein n=1 Tax=Acidithiobacillus sp. IBUN Pt1247-S3 TaxID=3166642 RepID=UPI0034E5F51E
MSELASVGFSLLWSFLAALLALLLLWGLHVTHVWCQTRLARALLRQRQGSLGQYLSQLQFLLSGFLRLLFWASYALVTALFVTFVLRQFDFSHHLGVRLSLWLEKWLGHVVQGILGSLPNLLMAVLIFVLARALVQANSAFLRRVENGRIRVSWISADLAAPTRQISALLIWLFALALAYPYLPGSSSATFQGVSVLAGLMISLGGQSVVGQALAGFSMLYSHALRAGEYVAIGNTRGTVVKIGIFATRIETGTGEEVSIPNAVVFSQPIRNFSRDGTGKRHTLQVSVSIDYSTPWRQVQAMLLAAARRSPGLLADPAPYVLQSALSDFYIEYTLVACFDVALHGGHALVQSHLHAEVLDVFNENDVQIMSPHFIANPAEPELVSTANAWVGTAQAALQPESQSSAVN